MRFIYAQERQSKNFVFTFLGFSTVVYFVVSFLSIAELGIGVGFGLFALFLGAALPHQSMPARR